MIVLVFDLLMLAVFGMVALRSIPDKLEVEAREIRDRSLVEMRESVAIGALLSPLGRVAGRSAARGVMGAFGGGRKRRK